MLVERMAIALEWFELFAILVTFLFLEKNVSFKIKKCQKNKNPIVVCIISQIDALEMYYTVMDQR